MVDFKIYRCTADQLYTEPDIINPRLVIEEGYWYLCTDTAELFLGTRTKAGTLTLARINGFIDPADVPTGDPDDEFIREILGAHINDETGELLILFSDGAEETLGAVMSEYGQGSFVTAVMVGDTAYEHTTGTIKLPAFVTAEDVAKLTAKPLSDLDEAIKALAAELTTSVSWGEL